MAIRYAWQERAAKTVLEAFLEDFTTGGSAAQLLNPPAVSFGGRVNVLLDVVVVVIDGRKYLSQFGQISTALFTP